MRGRVPQGVAETTDRTFHEQATRAIERTYVEDFDDPSILLSLYEKMTTDPSLSYMRDVWQPSLETAIGRAETLQRVSAPVRALRRALADAEPRGEHVLPDRVCLHGSHLILMTPVTHAPTGRPQGLSARVQIQGT